MDKDEITAEAQRLGTLSDLDHSRPGLLHAVHAAAPGDARAAAATSTRPSRRSIDEMVRSTQAVGRGRRARSFDFPVDKMNGSDLHRPRRSRGHADIERFEKIREDHTRQAGRHEGGFGRPRRDRRRRDGSARIAAEGARQGEAAATSATARSRSSRSLVTEVLTPHASAILLDPEWGIPASKRRAKNAGPAAGVREDRLRQTGRRAGCPTCSTTGPCAG